MALLLKKWVSELIDDFDSYGPPIFAERFTSSNRKDDSDLSFNELFPSTTRMHTTLASNCLTLSKEEYGDDCLDRKFCARFKSFADEQHRSVDESLVLVTSDPTDGTGICVDEPLPTADSTDEDDEELDTDDYDQNGPQLDDDFTQQ